MELNNIKQWYEDALHNRPIYLLREYLQYEILRILFSSRLSARYTFLGGTCLRIAYGTHRFSEDLDFDNDGLTLPDFEQTATDIKKGLELLGYTVNMKHFQRGAFHCKITFPALLFHYNLSGHKETKIMIKLDTEQQYFDYEPNLVTVNRFGIEQTIRATPLPLLASQKVAAIMGRKRPKGRDFYDLHWILQRQGINYNYLRQKLDIDNAQQLRSRVTDRIAGFDFNLLAEDVRGFLIGSDDVEIVRNFPSYWQTAALPSEGDYY